jgi:hypothetical protein
MLVYIRHPRHRPHRIYPRHLHALLLPAPSCAQRGNWKAWHGAKGRATQALSISRDVAGKRPFSLSLNPSRSTARKSPQKPRCALGQPVPDVDFSLYSKPPWIGLPERSRTMKLSFASGTSGASPPLDFRSWCAMKPLTRRSNSSGSPDPSAGATGGFRLSLIPNSHDETVRIGAPAPCDCQNQNPRQNQNRLADLGTLVLCLFLTDALRLSPVFRKLGWTMKLSSPFSEIRGS